MIHDSASIGPLMAMNDRDTPKVMRHRPYAIVKT